MSAVRGDALHLPLPDESVDLIITSPPYFALRSYRDEGDHYNGQIGSEDTPQAFLEALWTTTREMVRVLKPTGSIFVNLGDKYAGTHPGSGKHRNGRDEWQAGRADRPHVSTKFPTKSLMLLPHRYAIGCIDDLGLILRAEIVWSKPNGLPESVTDRVRRSHEQWFHFTKEPKYFSAVDEIREPQTGNDAKSRPEVPPSIPSNNGLNHRSLRRDPEKFNPLGKLPGSVWSIPSEPLKVPEHLSVEHFAAFPSEWPRRIILGWSPSGICVECGEGRRPVVETVGRSTRLTGYACACQDVEKGERADSAYPQEGSNEPILTLLPIKPAVVLDPFGGTGTVALVAHALGRIGISLDLSMDYCRLAKWRISQPASKVLSRTWHERQGAFL